MALPWEIVWFYDMMMEWTNSQRQTRTRNVPVSLTLVFQVTSTILPDSRILALLVKL